MGQILPLLFCVFFYAGVLQGEEESLFTEVFLAVMLL